MNTSVEKELDRIGRDLLLKRAELKLTWFVAAAAGWVFLFGLADLWLRLGRLDRAVAWVVLLALVGAGVAMIRATLKRRFTPEGIAAMVEKAFPELDNHLINYLQLSGHSEGDPFKRAYVRKGPPRWQQLDFTRMRNQEGHRRSRIALGIATALLILPGLFLGRPWGVALWRTVNPFSAAEPPSLTRILDVRPGTAVALQGEPLVLTCTVRGFKGHSVRVDIDPGDADKTTYALGSITTDVDQAFSHRVAKLSAGLRYRFRAGDSMPTAWFTISMRPPPAFTAIDMTVAPPAYTRRPRETRDARKADTVITAGSEVTLTAACNTPLKSLTLQAEGTAPVALSSVGVSNAWTGAATITNGSSLLLKADDVYGSHLEEQIRFALDPDRPPGIEILAPGGRTLLPPGERPQIEFRVADDFGLSEIALEEVPPDADDKAAGTARKRWTSTGAPSLQEVWKSEFSAARGRDVAFRLVARDNRPGHPNQSASAPIVFRTPTYAEAAKQRDLLEQEAFANLQRIVELQKRNILDTERNRRAMAKTEAARWNEATERQREIRTRTRELLANAIEPLGSLTPTVKKLYVNEMSLSIDSLAAIPSAEPAGKDKHAAEALTLEMKILRQLTEAEAAAAQAKLDRRVSGLSAMLESLVRDQGGALKQTQAFAEKQAKVSSVLVAAQDALSQDFAAFVTACSDEAAQVRPNDAAFADTLTGLAKRAEDAKIRNDMVMAAERLDQNQPAGAVPLEDRALGNLKGLQAAFDTIKLAQENGRRKAMLEAVAQAKETIDRVKELHERMLAAMEQVRGQKDKNDEMSDAMEEAYEELVKNTKEAMLQVPTDLHVFTDLNVANDQVEDVFSVFEEIEQVANSENMTAKDMVDRAFAKEEVMLEKMEEASDRLDDMEMWLEDIPDTEKVTTEAFDREEMPESGIAEAALASQVQDLISDLLQEPKELNDVADDSATTHALPDWESGWKVEEGNIASYGAQGKSGSQTPDHKEQDGRSNVGRQGMAVGETAAGSGTISEGDKNIEERRTEDPMQSGHIDLAGKADTRATGGGKLGTGKADDLGMGGGVERMDSNQPGSWEGMAALMARQADAVYAKASMKNVRVDALKDAAHHLRQSADAVATGDIQQVREFRQLAVTSLKRAKAELKAGPSGAIDAQRAPKVLNDVVESGPDQAPPQFRDRVADYFKALNDAL